MGIDPSVRPQPQDSEPSGSAGVSRGGRSAIGKGGRTLAEVDKPLAAGELIALAVALARAVGAMHRRGVLHRDIAPGNIVLAADGAPRLAGFGSATSLAEIRPAFTHHAEIVGTLAYVAPEQTGRTGRALDQRADLYALGATLYELATGTPPFGSGDPLQLTHDHLARVAAPPAELNPAVPAALSEIIMHLLEKEPDRRYQSAEGLLHDLELVRAGAAAGAFRVGERDAPLRLPPPSRLVGRDPELAVLTAAFAAALSGRCRGVLVGGAAGVGKSALVDELRPVVTGADGWFVAGKFDEYRRDLEFDATNQALRALGRLLLAEPDAEVGRIRERILAAVGANAALLAATVPEFAALLGVRPDPGDPLTAQARIRRATVQLLRASASRTRPLVVVVDDLQWAGPTPLGAVDLLLTEEPVEGLLLVGAYREGPADAAPARWRDQAGVEHVRLADLSSAGLVAMVAEMLREDPASAAPLAELIEPHTRGNPYETVEVLNGLRRHGALAPVSHGWRWETAAVRAQLERVDAARPAVGRLEAMPAPSQELLAAMACLGGRAELRLLEIATAEPAGVVEERLAPALEDRLLIMEPGEHPAVRFRHDRIREAILDRLEADSRRARQLAMARRLARVPELFAVAAEQYLPVADAVQQPAERRVLVELLRRAAGQAALIGDHALVSALLGAALPLVDPADGATSVEVRTRRHAALFSLGRLDEADDEYRAIAARGPSALERSSATAVQVRSLSHRTRFAEAIALGLQELRECGVAVPAPDRIGAELDHRFGRLHRWLEGTDPADDLARPELTDPTLLATARLIDAVLPVGYFVADIAMVAWLGLEALSIWTEHGTSPTLIGPVAHGAYHAAPQRGEYSAAYRALRRIVALGEARGYDPGTSQARHMLAAVTCWFEPIERGVRAAHRAREGLVAGDDLAYAGYTYQLSVPYLTDCAPSLDELAGEVDAGQRFLRETGNEQTSQWLDSYQWLAGVLRGEQSGGTGDALRTDRYADNPLPLLYAHLALALAAAVFEDPAGLAQHSAAVVPLLPVAAGSYATAVGQLLRGLSVAWQARAADRDERAGLLSECDEVTLWLATRTADAPENFLHLLRLVEAERAWAVGDFRAALLAFDAARQAVAGRGRPWHRALIAERAARFHLAHGVEHAGFELLSQARRDYLAWGASAKVARLDWAYPPAPAPGVTDGGGPLRSGAAVSSGTIDLLGILAASQALSSETSVERLHRRVVEVLGAMTGATGVHLMVWDDERREWLLPTPAKGGIIPVAGTQAERAVPLSVLRYAQRVGEPLVVADAGRDDRFARDPYLAGVDCCSILVVPVFSRGRLRAAVVLENRLIRGAFSAERLDAVKLIAGQLAVSLDNAELYAELAGSRERIVAAGDEARRRIERDLHDGAQQGLVHAIVVLKLARRALADADADGNPADVVADALQSVERANEEMRELARGIHPRILSSEGLGPALERLTARSPVPVTLEGGTDARLAERVEVSAYYVVSEAMTNAVKHAHATAMRVAVHTAGGVLRVSISDDGVGGADPARGSGLLGLRDRVEALGGTLTVDSAPGQGTRLFVEIPLDAA